MSQFWFTREDDGLKAGEPSTWALGAGPDAFRFDVEVREVEPSRKIVIAWGHDEENPETVVTWTFEETEGDDTILTIVETGFTGDDEARVARALDSTGGFNQVIVAAKAFVEHGVAMNVVADHA